MVDAKRFKIASSAVSLRSSSSQGENGSMQKENELKQRDEARDQECPEMSGQRVWRRIFDVAVVGLSRGYISAFDAIKI